MRILYSILIAIFLLGSTWAYTRFADGVRAEFVPYIPNFAEGEYSIEISRTFDCVADEIFELPALSVRFRGNEVYKRERMLPASEAVRIENLPDVETGANDFNVTASFGETDDSMVAMRVQIFQGSIEIANEVIADSPELSMLSGVVSFTVDGIREGEKRHSH